MKTLTLALLTPGFWPLLFLLWCWLLYLCAWSQELCLLPPVLALVPWLISSGTHPSHYSQLGLPKQDIIFQLKDFLFLLLPEKWTSLRSVSAPPFPHCSGVQLCQVIREIAILGEYLLNVSSLLLLNLKVNYSRYSGKCQEVSHLLGLPNMSLPPPIHIY